MIYLVAESKTSQGAKRQDSRDWNKKPGDKVNISCYTNCMEAELYINGNINSHESYQSNRRISLHGHFLAYIKAKSETGKAIITLTSTGLQKKQIVINNSLQ